MLPLSGVCMIRSLSYWVIILIAPLKWAGRSRHANADDNTAGIIVSGRHQNQGNVVQANSCPAGQQGLGSVADSPVPRVRGQGLSRNRVGINIIDPCLTLLD